jgi:hypothetical protein
MASNLHNLFGFEPATFAASSSSVLMNKTPGVGLNLDA